MSPPLLLPVYWIGACVGRGSVVGDGAGVTVCTDGPTLVASLKRVVTVRGMNKAMSKTTMATAE